MQARSERCSGTARAILDSNGRRPRFAHKERQDGRQRQIQDEKDIDPSRFPDGLGRGRAQRRGGRQGTRAGTTGARGSRRNARRPAAPPQQAPAAVRRAPRRPHRLRRAGPRPHGILPAHPRHPDRRGLRHLGVQPPVRQRLPQQVRPEAERLRGLPRPPGQGERTSTRPSWPPRTGSTPSTPTPAWSAASTSTAKRRCPTRWRRPGPWCDTARRTKKLLQIGHQRRSNPRYLHAIDRLIREKKILGRINLAYAQWNRSKTDMLGWPKKYTIPADKLERYGYDSMVELPQLALVQEVRRRPDRRPRLPPDRPLRLGLRREPQHGRRRAAASTTTRTASGTTTSWPSTSSRRPRATARAFYQVQTTTKHGGFYETFMGDDGSLVRSPRFPSAATGPCARPTRRNGIRWSRTGCCAREAQAIQKVDTRNVFVDVRVTAEAGRWPLPGRPGQAGPPAAPRELLLGGPPRDAPELPGRAGLRERGGGPQSQRRREIQEPDHLPARAVHGMNMQRQTGPVTSRPLRPRSAHPPVGNPFRSDARGLIAAPPVCAAPERQVSSELRSSSCLCIISSSLAAGQTAPKPKTQWDGSRTTPVHLIPLKDAVRPADRPDRNQPPAVLGPVFLRSLPRLCGHQRRPALQRRDGRQPGPPGGALGLGGRKNGDAPAPLLPEVGRRLEPRGRRPHAPGISRCFSAGTCRAAAWPSPPSRR